MAAQRRAFQTATVASVALDGETVDVWRVAHDQSPTLRDRLAQSLTEAERARLRRFVVEPPREAFLVTRAVLRHLLSLYLNSQGEARSPREIALETTDRGKPRLATVQQPASSSIAFNVSHSGGLSLLAFSRGGAVGVDLESCRRDPSNFENVARYFASEERAVLDELDGRAHREAFFRCWTRKEAYLKARGAGMSVELDAFAVSVEPDDPTLVRVDRDRPEDWTMVDLDPGDAHTAALCVRRREELEVRRLQADRAFLAALVGRP